MQHFPVETAIWIALLVIGVVSSLVSKSKKIVSRSRQPISTVFSQAMPPQTVELPQPVVVEPVVPPAPPVIVAARPLRSTAPTKAPVPPPAAAAHGTPAFRGMFERGSLVRAIVAAEVLGPPKALQEQSIWSPRHNEPSI